MSACIRCGQEFTKEEKKAVNYRKEFEGYYHRLCPGTTCFVCGEAITDRHQAFNPQGNAWRHNGCKPDTSRIQARLEKLRKEEARIEDGSLSLLSGG